MVVGGGATAVELVLLVELAANAGAIPAALIKIPSNTRPLALILTTDGFPFSYLSNYLK